MTVASSEAADLLNKYGQIKVRHRMYQVIIYCLKGLSVEAAKEIISAVRCVTVRDRVFPAVNISKQFCCQTIYTTLLLKILFIVL